MKSYLTFLPSACLIASQTPILDFAARTQSQTDSVKSSDQSRCLCFSQLMRILHSLHLSLLLFDFHTGLCKTICQLAQTYSPHHSLFKFTVFAYESCSEFCSTLKLRWETSQQIENKLRVLVEVTSGAICKFYVGNNPKFHFKLADVMRMFGSPQFISKTAPWRPDEMLFECVIWSRRFWTSAASASTDCISRILLGNSAYPVISFIS